MAWTTIKENVEIRLPKRTLTGKLAYNPERTSLIIADHEAVESTVLTVDLTIYGYEPIPGEVFVKGHWHEPTGLPEALESAGIASVVDSLTVGSFNHKVYQMKLTDTGDALKPHYIVIERHYSETLAIEYPDKTAVDRALEHSLFIDGLCEEDCLDAYVTTVLPAGAHIVIPPEGDTYPSEEG